MDSESRGAWGPAEGGEATHKNQTQKQNEKKTQIFFTRTHKQDKNEGEKAKKKGP